MTVTHDLQTYGLILLFGLVAVESAGIPLPGETALITAGVLAAGGRFNIVAVIAVAAIAAIVGDSTGYWIARTGGRKAITTIPVVRDTLPKLLPRGERYFERHGPKTVVIGRFVAGLRVTVAWLAGISHMPWVKFVFYNAIGGILWATSVGLAAYYFGTAAINAVEKYGLIAVGVIIALLILGYFGHRWFRARMEKRAEALANSQLESGSAE
jgi:membrane protein DedA with SNARE-associated domain